jgi:magnesium transporter
MTDATTNTPADAPADGPADPTTDFVRTRVWRNGKLEAENFPFEQVSDFLEQPDCLVWADLCAPSQQRLAELADELCLDRHAVEDALSIHERPKAMRYETHLFLSAYSVRADPAGGIATTHVSAFGLPRGIFTVRLDSGFNIDTVVQHWDDNADLLKYGPRALLHGLLDVMVDEYFEAVESLDDDIEALEDVLFEESSRASTEVQRQSFNTRKSLVQIRRAILPMREVVNTVMRRAIDDQDHSELVPYFEDLYDHVLRAAEWTESLRDLISSIFETNLSLADARLNTVMKKLTSWAAIIAVPTAITGFFGQNVPYPGFGREWGFYFSLIAMVVVAGSLYAAFRARDWL